MGGSILRIITIRAPVRASNGDNDNDCENSDVDDGSVLVMILMMMIIMMDVVDDDDDHHQRC